MKFLFYFLLVSFMSAIPAAVISKIISFVSDDIGLFVGLFVFVGLVCESFARREPNSNT
jgi:hypothetical protein